MVAERICALGKTLTNKRTKNGCVSKYIVQVSENRRVADLMKAGQRHWHSSQIRARHPIPTQNKKILVHFQLTERPTAQTQLGGATEKVCSEAATIVVRECRDLHPIV